MTREAALRQACTELKLVLQPGTEERLLRYLDMMAKWNRVYNLTAIRESARMLSHHLLDSLAIAPALAGVQRLLDVGTGPGLPGVPLALVYPSMRVTLLDSNQKKTTFLAQARIELGLANVDVVCERVERHQPDGMFDGIVSRAYSDLKAFAEGSRHLCAPGGKLFAMKGLYPHEEVAALPPWARVVEALPIRVPGLEAERHLIILEVSHDG